MELWLASKSISSMFKATNSMKTMQGERDPPCISSIWLRSDFLTTPIMAMVQCTRWQSKVIHLTGNYCQPAKSPITMRSAEMSSSTCNHAIRITMASRHMEDFNGQWSKAQSMSNFAKRITASTKYRLKGLRSTSTYFRWIWLAQS